MITSNCGRMHRLRNDDDDTVIELNISDGEGAAAAAAARAAAGGGTGTLNLDPDEVTDENADRGDSLDGASTVPGGQSTIPGGQDTAPGGQDTVAGGDTTGNRIPQARFNEVVSEKNAAIERARQLEEENARLKAGTTTATPAPPAAAAATPTPPAFDFKAQERAYAELLADGDFDKAADLRLTIDTTRSELTRAEVRAELVQEQAMATVTSVANQAVADYPFLDTTDGAPAMAAIIAQRTALERSGVPAHEALQQAVDKIAPLFGAKASAAPAQPGTPGKGSTTATPPVDNRPAAAVRRGAAAANAQPPLLNGGTGNAAATATQTDDVLGWTETQFENITDAEKRRLRGD